MQHGMKMGTKLFASANIFVLRMGKIRICPSVFSKSKPVSDLHFLGLGAYFDCWVSSKRAPFRLALFYSDAVAFSKLCDSAKLNMCKSLIMSPRSQEVHRTL